jgi:hypothetical protein
MTESPTLATLIVIGLFAIAYLAFLIRKTTRGGLDLYDLIMLSLVAIVPAVFAFAPSIANFISHLAGVAFPFVVMFGILLAVLFLILHRITVQMHRVEQRNRLLIQELSLLQLEIKQRREDS